MQEREYIQCYASLLLVDSLYTLNCSNIRCNHLFFILQIFKY